MTTAMTAWPTVTGEPGSPHVIFEDSSLPHQPVLFMNGGRIALSCNCLTVHRRNRGIIVSGSPLPAREAMAAYRQWHIDHGELVWP